MNCQNCKSTRILEFSGGDSKDCFWAEINGNEHEGYMLSDLGLGDEGPEGKLCLNCGQMQGKWPLPKSSMEE